jgi:hypothetical protein
MPAPATRIVINATERCLRCFPCIVLSSVVQNVSDTVSSLGISET